MRRSLFKNSAETRVGAVQLLLGAALCAGVPVAVHAQTAPAAQMSLLDRATAAERVYQFDVAMDHLYQLVLERPRTDDAARGRFRLARLLALNGELSAAMLEYQALRDETGSDEPLRELALDYSTILSRRLRASPAGYYPATELLSVRSLANMDEPTTIAVTGRSGFVIVDSDAKRAYKISGDTAVTAPGVVEPTAATVLPDGSNVLAGKTGLVIGSNKPAMFTAQLGGRTRQLNRVRAMAANSHGDLFLVDREYNGLLRCKAGTTSCAPWGPPGRLRTVKVGLSDFVYVLDDSQRSIRVVDDTGRQVATWGPAIGGTTRLEKVMDIAIDAAYGVYLLDADQRRVQIGALRADANGRLAITAIASVAIPTEGERALRNPSAIGTTPNGALIVAGQSSRILRFD